MKMNLRPSAVLVASRLLAGCSVYMAANKKGADFEDLEA